MLDFQEEGKPENEEKSPGSKAREPTPHSTHVSLEQGSNPRHIHCWKASALTTAPSAPLAVFVFFNYCFTRPIIKNPVNDAGCPFSGGLQASARDAKL